MMNFKQYLENYTLNPETKKPWRLFDFKDHVQHIIKQETAKGTDINALWGSFSNVPRVNLYLNPLTNNRHKTTPAGMFAFKLTDAIKDENFSGWDERQYFIIFKTKNPVSEIGADEDEEELYPKPENINIEIPEIVYAVFKKHGIPATAASLGMTGITDAIKSNILTVDKLRYAFQGMTNILEKISEEFVNDIYDGVKKFIASDLEKFHQSPNYEIFNREASKLGLSIDRVFMFYILKPKSKSRIAVKPIFKNNEKYEMLRTLARYYQLTKGGSLDHNWQSLFTRLLKNVGLTQMADTKDSSLIHDAEPSQAVFVSTSNIEIIRVIDLNRTMHARYGTNKVGVSDLHGRQTPLLDYISKVLMDLTNEVSYYQDPIKIEKSITMLQTYMLQFFSYVANLIKIQKRLPPKLSYDWEKIYSQVHHENLKSLSSKIKFIKIKNMSEIINSAMLKIQGIDDGEY